MYKSFSYYYDKMMEDIDYDYFINIVKKYVPINYCILDAGCGTGTITMALKKEGYEICGVDNSSDMLMICKNKMEDNNLFFPIYENNIEEELPIEAFDCVISFLDVINYTDYKKVFKNIYDSLKKEGLFIFDVDQVEYLNGLKGYQEKEEYEDFKYEWNILDNGDNAIIHDLLIVDNNNQFKEKHYQKTYEKKIYIDELEKLGFCVEELKESDDIKLYLKAKK